MRIKVSVMLDVNPEAWERTYGVEKDLLRTDVLLWATNLLDESLDAIDCRAEVKPKYTIAAHTGDGVPDRPAMRSKNVL